MHSRNRDDRAAGRRALAWRIARHVVGGLLTGAAVGYLAALVLPRRYPVPAGSYQAPVPPGVGAEVG
ncbi:hypothetical protein [Angustibacter sp. Root456]|uniref:hypothetical protein n=1 Tax=Angustibacter sp. Root456 TaxID=1736539 RepID=UPI0006F60EE7|nr:hypothetical protein [Angustibacter sp. Root456]KQX61866.1 hypothetical protein ASD06_15050 [Angustibacter sp. Root456]